MFSSRDVWSGSAGTVEVAFTDRHGGVSEPPYDSLDLSAAPERQEEVRRNISLVAAAIGVERVVSMRQVHGADVVVLGEDDVGAVRAAAASPRCDALVARSPTVALCVRMADCVPVVLADPDVGVVAVAHAGRSGVSGGVVPATVAAMRRNGAAEILAAVGPHVCGGCYEVPAALRDQVATQVPAAYACTRWGTPSLDLGAGVSAQLAAAGCRVVDRSRCTKEDPALFSHRRDGAAAGRLAGLVAFRDGR